MMNDIKQFFVCFSLYEVFIKSFVYLKHWNFIFYWVVGILYIFCKSFVKYILQILSHSLSLV